MVPHAIPKNMGPKSTHFHYLPEQLVLLVYVEKLICRNFLMIPSKNTSKEFVVQNDFRRELFVEKIATGLYGLHLHFDQLRGVNTPSQQTSSLLSDPWKRIVFWHSSCTEGRFSWFFSQSLAKYDTLNGSTAS